MPPKHVLFRSEAREKVLRGATALADAIRVTLGPKSKCVLIEKKYGKPVVCNDGVTIPDSPPGTAASWISTSQKPHSGCDIVVFAEDANRTGLRPFFAFLLDECDRSPHRHVIERIVQHARAVEVETLLARLNESVSVHVRDRDDLAVRRYFVSLDGPSLLPREVLQASPRGVERLVDGHTAVPVHTLDLVLLVMRVILRADTQVGQRLVAMAALNRRRHQRRDARHRICHLRLLVCAARGGCTSRANRPEDVACVGPPGRSVASSGSDACGGWPPGSRSVATGRASACRTGADKFAGITNFFPRRWTPPANTSTTSRT